MRLLRRAAEQGHADAQYKLGVMYQDYAHAQYKLGEMYQEGNSIAQNFNSARYWYGLAAKQGHAHAQNNLGSVYANGWGGITPNFDIALYWYQQAAAQGLDVAIKVSNELAQYTTKPSKLN